MVLVCCQAGCAVYTAEYIDYTSLDNVDCGVLVVEATLVVQCAVVIVHLMLGLSSVSELCKLVSSH